MLIDRAANRLFSDFVASKIRQRVKDPEVAEKLIPKDHGFGTRRVPQETHYYEVYNQPNVELVSILDTPIERITRTGLRTSDRAFEFDIIVYATGFDAITGSFDRIDIRGQGGQRLKDKWKGGPATFMGVMVDGFPNMFMVMGPHTALGNIPRSIEYNVEWIRDLIGYMDARGLARGGRPARGGGRVDGLRQEEGRGPPRQRGRLLDDGRQHERRGQARPHHRPLQRHGAGIPRMVRPGGRRWIPGAWRSCRASAVHRPSLTAHPVPVATADAPHEELNGLWRRSARRVRRGDHLPRHRTTTAGTTGVTGGHARERGRHRARLQRGQAPRAGGSSRQHLIGVCRQIAGTRRTSHRLARWEVVPLIGSRAAGSTVRLKFAPSGLNGS